MLAHVSERALVLLLPTDVYMTFGVLAVALTVLLTMLIPASWFRALARSGPDDGSSTDRPTSLRTATSLAAFLCLAGLIVIGGSGSRDPLVNLLPLTLFTVWWICLPLAQALFGNLWAWVNPWSGPARIVFRKAPIGRYPVWLGYWPAVATYFAVAIYALSDLAPDDPERLAYAVACYWCLTFAMYGIFGPVWLERGEGITVFFTLLARMTPFKKSPRRIGFPGACLVISGAMPVSLAVFSVTLLALGSFDGLNETFWWMAQIGINPLEFPGRSAVVWPNRLGMFLAVVALNAAFAASVFAGLGLIRATGEFSTLWPRLALSLVPIALGYHFAHYLTSAMVNLQYFVVSLNDPFANGNGFLGLNSHWITTSFFNQHHTVRLIWLTQAGAIVLAHMIAVVLTHALALSHLGSHRAAVISQLPVAGFMLAYTFFGLWLLASPVAL